MAFFLCALLGYLIGSINPAYILGKIKGLDIRKKGSGNAGASNALILFGKLAGALCAVLDIAKTFGVILLTGALFPHFSLAFAVTSVFCILGHIFPFYMHFKGGKGLACLGGMVLAYDWRVLLVLLAVEIVILLITGYLCFVPITASFLFPVIYGVLSRNFWGAALLLFPAFVILQRHTENLRRIPQGTEMHISYLWNPRKEMDRLIENISEDPARISEHFLMEK